MGRDYYRELGVAKDAKDADIKKAYRKAAVQWHPDKWAGRSESEQKTAEERFKEVAEAYDVLSDPDKRAVFDRYGEEGLKAGGPPPPASDGDTHHFGGFGQGGSSFAHGGGGGAGYEFRGDPADIFAQFFSGGFKRQNSFGETPFDGHGGLEEMLAGMGGGGGGRPKARRCHLPEREHTLPCTLEELYRGKLKKMKVTRKSLTPGRPTEKILELPIRPGFKAGTRITFSGEGDEYAVPPPGAPPCAQDIVFIIREAKHERFHREGSDLHYRIKISLSDALCGFTHDIKMLDEQERVKRLNMRTPVSNVTTKVLAGEGMPKSKEPGKKGDLIISFEVAFPTRELTDTQKAAVRSALPMG